MTTTYLTPAGVEKLEDELYFLPPQKRKEIADILHEAAEGEDSGPDVEAGNDSAKNLQSFVEGHIYELERILANVHPFDRPKSQEFVERGALVTILDAFTNEVETYTIVDPVETNPLAGNISDHSPLGKALLGSRLHEEVNVQTPSGRLIARIIKIG
jgi:transcription elongation factor GreA